MSAVVLSGGTAIRLLPPSGGDRARAGLPSAVRYRESGPRLLWPDREGARRVVNVVVAALGLLAAAPVMAVIAVLVKLTSPGPVLFGQTRVGLDRRRRDTVGGRRRRGRDLGGRPFTIYKFRTMRVARAAHEAWAGNETDRVTSVGRLLRRARLDELPQLLNVLKGDMNVVGPRPEQPQIFERLCREIESYPRRQRVRPGITGWAQINLPYDCSVHDVRQKVAYDLQYIWRQSAVEDLKIMARTLPVMLSGEGSR